jgi:hypothetical protein
MRARLMSLGSVSFGLPHALSNTAWMATTTTRSSLLSILAMSLRMASGFACRASDTVSWYSPPRPPGLGGWEGLWTVAPVSCHGGRHGGNPGIDF